MSDLIPVEIAYLLHGRYSKNVGSWVEKNSNHKADENFYSRTLSKMRFYLNRVFYCWDKTL